MTDHERMRRAVLALRAIRDLSNYPGEGRSTFADLADKRRRINRLACDALEALSAQAGAQ